jgi:DNA-binding response OmpR family regulator
MRNLLLIEDNVELRGVLREAVEIDGYDVTLAENAEVGMRLLNSGYLPDFILCDVVLPHMNGLDFLRAIRANPQWKHIFFIAMSGSMDSKYTALESGANYYLIKPFNFHELFDVLAKN